MMRGMEAWPRNMAGCEMYRFPQHASVLWTSGSSLGSLNLRPRGRGYFLPALRASSTSILVVCCFSVVCAVATCAAEPGQLAFPVGEAPFRAELVGIDREWNISFKAAGKVRVIGAGELGNWGRWSDVEAGPQVLLSDGGVVRADVLLVDEKQIVVGDATGLGRGFWEESNLPRGAAAAILYQPPAQAAERDRLWKRLTSSSGRDDTLFLVGGETVTGTLVSAPQLGRYGPEETKPGSETFQITRRGGIDAIGISAGKVIAVQFGMASEGTAGRTSRGTRVWMGLSGGSLVQALSVSARGGVVTIELAAGGELKTTLAGRDDPDKRFWDAVTYLEPVNARVGWLADRESLGYKHIPFVSVERPLGIDQSVVGTRLRSGGGVFRKGVGMPSASRVAYDVAGYRRFEAEIAIDDVAGQGGSVVFKVVLQTAAGAWQTAYESPIVRGGDAPVSVSVDLKGANRMALLVEFAERGDELDYADWIAARLVK